MSQLPPSDHVVWKILRTAVVGAILVAMLSLNYNKFDNRDIVTIITAMLGLAGYDTAKTMITRNPGGSEVSDERS